jgi:hypothetical protein
MRAMASRGAYTAARVLSAIGYAIVAILVIHIVLTLLGANPANAFAAFFATAAGFFSLGLGNLFLFPDNPALQTAVNYGIAAVIWLVITAIVTGIIRRVG